ncbi:MAG: hypothetical protein WAU25_07920, partial [Nitrososphaeraceae archaeon]
PTTVISINVLSLVLRLANDVGIRNTLHKPYTLKKYKSFDRVCDSRSKTQMFVHIKDFRHILSQRIVIS